ncbi:MAG TPA: 4'-phosphopantetheinyl transferase superfamily protein [Vicinamibacteria bacterium]|nr:4'-phosphopantetheinyl transferase superfamily protein [Vicinamibacteria bacterium]
MKDVVEIAEASLEEIRRLCDVSALLDDEERNRAARFRSVEARDRFVGGRALLKTLLGASLQRPAASVRVRVEPDGRPVLLDPEPGVEFSISHSGERVVVAWADRVVGVDIERLRPLPGALDLARRFFDAGEAASLEKEPVERRSAAFLELWTRKEALLKARGIGLAAGLAAPLGANGELDVRPLLVSEGYVGAIAARGHEWSVARR